MPLAFESASHGQIAFGFFNIESDMLLLENYFFFADEFCALVGRIADNSPAERFETSCQAYHIAKREDIGDLMGAIDGVRFTGFIGETYRRYPFPQRPEDFKQKPEGSETQAVFREMVEKYANQVEIPFAADPSGSEVSVGEYRFTRSSFQEMIQYVWAGGYPRWKDEVRPGYVTAMKETIEKSGHWVFEGLQLRPG
jgi:hypothetical protein